MNDLPRHAPKETVGFVALQSMLKKLDAWRMQQKPVPLTRSEAIRALLDRALNTGD
jgi:hypothetical protein